MMDPETDDYVLVGREGHEEEREEGRLGLSPDPATAELGSQQGRKEQVRTFNWFPEFCLFVARRPCTLRLRRAGGRRGREAGNLR